MIDSFANFAFLVNTWATPFVNFFEKFCLAVKSKSTTLALLLKCPKDIDRNKTWTPGLPKKRVLNEKKFFFTFLLYDTLIIVLTKSNVTTLWKNVDWDLLPAFPI